MKKFIVRPSRLRQDLQSVTIIVDDEDAILLRSQPWIVTIHGVNGGPFIKQSCASSQTEWRRGLGQVIMGSKEGEIVEHINHDKLDFRRVNLRVVAADEYYKRAARYAHGQRRAAPT